MIRPSCRRVPADGPRGRRLAALAALASLALFPPPTAGQDKPAGARLWVEAGPSVDRTHTRTNSSNGYALAGGVDIGRTVALTLGAAVEHYPHEGPATSAVIAGPSGPDTLRVEGGGNKIVTSLSAGVRVAMSGKRLEPIVEASLGFASVAHDTPRYVDPVTGAVVFPSGRYEWSGVMGQLGLGVQTHSGKRVDALLEVRWRGATSGPEGSSTSSIQLLLGVTTR